MSPEISAMTEETAIEFPITLKRKLAQLKYGT